MATILIAEDEKDLRYMMSEYLENYGFKVFKVVDGEAALDVIDKTHIDLLITDIMMPNIDGNKLTKTLRLHNYNMPILMITAKETIDDKEIGFRNGTDDYMVKPIILKEMLLRVNSLLRRANINLEQKIVIGKLELNESSFTVNYDNEDIELTKKEFQLLFKLLSNPNKIFTKSQIMDEIWGYDTDSGDATVKVHISRIREKFSKIEEFKIVAVKGLGYKAVASEKI